jgi:hypothetical protein
MGFMKIEKRFYNFLSLMIVCVAVSAHAQQSNTVFTITSPQESNVVTRIERFDIRTKSTNVTIKTKFYKLGRLIEDKSERRGGAIDIKASRIYHQGNLVMLEAWDSKSKLTQRTFLRDGHAVITEVISKSDRSVDLILFHGKNEEIVTALKQDASGELKMLDAVGLAEIQSGSKVGTKLIKEVSGEVENKSNDKH